jgi:HNH endonuclease
VSGTFAGALALLFLPVIALVSVGGPGMLVPREWRAWWRNFKIPGLWAHERGKQHSSRIPLRTQDRVRRACRNRCVCGAVGVQIDHIVPWSAGGLSRVWWNLGGLCGPCNRLKLTLWTDRRGVLHGLRRTGRKNEARAREIVAAELRRRRSPLYWLRALAA